jgi:hypothetical protein
MRKVFERKDPGRARRARDLAAVHRPRRARRRQAAHVDPPHEPAAADLARTGTEANVKLTAEIADGWLPLGFVPRLMPMLRPGSKKASGAPGGGKGFTRLRDPAARGGRDHRRRASGALARMKPRVALYVGGMGHRDKNFHKEMMIRRGFGDAAQKIQELYLAKRKDEAVAAVPDEFCDEMSLVGRSAGSASGTSRGPIPESPGSRSPTEQTEAMELMASLAGSVR